METSSNGTLQILTADEIWAAKDIEERVIAVPQWPTRNGSPGAVRIKTLSQKQSGELRRRASRTNMVTKQTEIDNDLLEALLFIEGVVEPKFTMADYDRLREKSMAAVSTVLRAVMDASGLSEESVRDATKSVTERADQTFRVSVGAGVEDDTGGTPDAHVG